MKNVEPAKRSPGRPRRSGEKPEQFSVRLPPKLKFGLELLAQAQGGRSLSQATEWAIQVGMRRQAVGESNVSDVLDAAWEKTTEPERLFAVWKIDPSLLGFEDRAFCELMASPALAYLMEPQELVPEWLEFTPEQRAELQESVDVILQNRSKMLSNWKSLRDDAVELINKGHSFNDMRFEYLEMLLLKIKQQK